MDAVEGDCPPLFDKYVTDVRPLLVADPDEGVLFLSRTGESFAEGAVTRLVAQYVRAAGIGKQGSCHLFRHAMATLMLENGADIRFIQQMLGHARLDTTQIYTQVSIRKLKEVHELTHPAKMQRQKDPDDGGDPKGIEAKPRPLADKDAGAVAVP